MMNFLVKIAFFALLAGILPAFAGVCDTPKVKKQLEKFLFEYFDKDIKLENDFYLKPAVSFNKDLGVQMDIKEFYKGKKDTLCAVKVRLNALHAEIPNTDAFEKFIYENDRVLYNGWEVNENTREHIKNILRIYAYNKWTYSKEHLWHFYIHKSNLLQGLERLTFYRVKFDYVQDSLISQDFLRISLNYDFMRKFNMLKKLELACEKDENAEISFSGITCPDCIAKCEQLKFLPALEKNYEWITGKKLENSKFSDD